LKPHLVANKFIGTVAQLPPPVKYVDVLFTLPLSEYDYIAILLPSIV